MKITNLGYLIKEGIRGVFLHGFMSFAAVCVTVACLLIVGTFSSLMYNVNIMVEDLNKTNEIMVYVDETFSDAEARSVGTQINRIANVQKATFVSRQQALENFAADYSDSSLFSGVDATTLRHRFVVLLVDNHLLTETAEALRGINGVVGISAAYEEAEGFSTLQDVLEVLSIVLIAVLLVVSLLIISNTVKLAMYDRKDEISIMKMVGATNGFIRLPFVVEGFILGMLGAVIAFFAEWGMYDALVAQIEAMDSEIKFFSFVPFEEMMWFMVAIFAAAGLFVGILGSWTSIRKFMNV